MVQGFEEGSGGDVLDEHSMCSSRPSTSARPSWGNPSTTFLGKSRCDGVGNRHRVRPAVFQATVDAWCASTAAAPSTGRSIAYRFGGFSLVVVHSDRRLGLKLEGAKGPVPVLGIDHIEQPSPD